MKQNFDFCAALYAYNRVHRLIGNVSCETLLKESAEAIKNSPLSEYEVMVDVGAGSGILGFAWLKGNAQRRLVLVEPEKKAVAFLHLFFSQFAGRAKVISKRLEDLSPEEVLSWGPQFSEKVFLATRAFSSHKSLEDCYRESGLQIPLYVFEKGPQGFHLQPK